MREREPRPHTQRGDLVVSRATMDALRASLRGGASNDITDLTDSPARLHTPRRIACERV